MTDCGRCHSCSEDWKWRDDLERIGCDAGDRDLRVRGVLRVVLGASRVAGAERDLPLGDEIGRSKHRRLRQHVLHSCNRPVLPRHAVSHEMGSLHPLRRIDRDHVLVHHLAATGDEAGADRGDVSAVAEALVLEAHRLQGCRQDGSEPAAGEESSSRPSVELSTLTWIDT